MLLRELTIDGQLLRSLGSVVFNAAGHTSRFSVASTLLVVIVLGVVVHRRFESMGAQAR